MHMCQEMVEKLNPIHSVMHQEGAQNIQLAPGTIFVEKPLCWVFEGIEHVMKMNDHPCLQRWQSAKKVKINIAAAFGDVGGVDKEDIVLFQRSDEFNIDVLGSGF